MKVKNQTNQKKCVMLTAIGLVVFAFTIALGIYSCTKHPNTTTAPDGVQNTALKTNSAQPLPQGKARFSVVLGRMDTTPWVRIGDWTFTAATGTVAATFWSWSYDDKHDVQIFGSHTCTWDGVTRTVNTYTPYGWQVPGGLSANWGGTYTYNATTGRLHMDWTSGAGAGNSEDWDVSLPDAALARVKFVAGSSTYHVTHGRGYGSNAPWPDNSGTDHPTAYKTMDELPASLTVTSTTGRHVEVQKIGGTPFTTPSTPNAWAGAAWGGSTGMKTPSAPIPINCKHYWDLSATCSGSCATSRVGIMYHWSSKNINRQMTWVNFCACLAHDTGTAPLWPGYGGNMHPQAQFQILDDNSVMRGVIGIETQNPPSTGPQSSGYPDFQFQLQDFTTLAGS